MSLKRASKQLVDGLLTLFYPHIKNNYIMLKDSIRAHKTNTALFKIFINAHECNDTSNVVITKPNQIFYLPFSNPFSAVHLDGFYVGHFAVP